MYLLSVPCLFRLLTRTVISRMRREGQAHKSSNCDYIDRDDTSELVNMAIPTATHEDELMSVFPLEVSAGQIPLKIDEAEPEGIIIFEVTKEGDLVQSIFSCRVESLNQVRARLDFSNERPSGTKKLAKTHDQRVESTTEQTRVHDVPIFNETSNQIPDKPRSPAKQCEVFANPICAGIIPEEKSAKIPNYQKNPMKQNKLPDVPSPFKRALYWPADKKQPPKKRCAKEKIPTVRTSDDWKRYMDDKERKKLKIEEEKLLKKKQRLENLKIKKEKVENARKQRLENVKIKKEKIDTRIHSQF